MTDDQHDAGDQHDAKDAHVQVLTAEVRTLVVGSRQVTLSVYDQLDEVSYEDIEPFGRVHPKDASDLVVRVVGRDRETGALVRSRTWTWDMMRDPSTGEIANVCAAGLGKPALLDIAQLMARRHPAGDGDQARLTELHPIDEAYRH